METIDRGKVQEMLNQYQNQPVYIHVEITSGVYADHLNEDVFNAGTFLRNIQVEYIQGAIRGGKDGAYRVGLKLVNGGWIYVLGLTHYAINENDEFIMHGFDHDGKLASALEISSNEFFK
ncbi:DUF1806 family protein [Lacicoccus alkaliphilus]|uniref:DUF1806 family protein n=1 Tax=Lacicoccus alkaliphilus DSM 16010 TaxID=1123231 RepID=A0A1M7HZZ4_9BACL|nr:DUF1806 family protein [Salinicoccus alkaliphilus]SHM34030.1 Protein of unknown function [Salinicoccus alkaliphilus DSM 16010]